MGQVPAGAMANSVRFRMFFFRVLSSYNSSEGNEGFRSDVSHA